MTSWGSRHESAQRRARNQHVYMFITGLQGKLWRSVWRWNTRVKQAEVKRASCRTETSELIDRLLSTSLSASQPAVNTFCILSGYITDTANIYYHYNLLLPVPSFSPWHVRKLFTGKAGNCWLYFLTNSPKIFNSTANSHISEDGTVNIGYLWSDIRFQ